MCICTYKRPAMLALALKELISQVTHSRFSYEIVVVDNDVNRSAAAVIEQLRPQIYPNIIYACENEQNISLARNLCVRIATGNYIAFIDDDETPVTNWLYELYVTLIKFKADGVLGPVLPCFSRGAPKWLHQGNIFDRRRFSTGTQLNVRDTRTGNVLLTRSLFHESENWFDPAYGRTGGEDVDFFRRQIANGRQFVFCNEAVAYETIPPERWHVAFHLKKYLRIGTLNGERLRKFRAARIIGLLKTMVVIPVWLVVLLLLFPFGKHLWIRPALKLAYSLGCLAAACGISLIRYRD